jgi:hypothetical protein
MKTKFSFLLGTGLGFCFCLMATNVIGQSKNQISNPTSIVPAMSVPGANNSNSVFISGSTETESYKLSEYQKSEQFKNGTLTINMSRDMELRQKMSLTNDPAQIAVINHELELIGVAPQATVNSGNQNIKLEVKNTYTSDKRFLALSDVDKEAISEKVSNGADFESLISGF